MITYLYNYIIIHLYKKTAKKRRLDAATCTGLIHRQKRGGITAAGAQCATLTSLKPV